MIVADGKPYFPYLLLLDGGGRVLGLDPRSIKKVEAEWMEKRRASARRQSQLDRASIRAEIQNALLVQQRGEKDDPVLGQHQGVSLDDVAAPPSQEIDADEILRLSGLPDDGYGCARIEAASVTGIARAWGEEAHDFCMGVPTHVVRSRKGKPKKRKGKATTHRKGGRR